MEPQSDETKKEILHYYGIIEETWRQTLRTAYRDEDEAIFS